MKDVRLDNKQNGRLDYAKVDIIIRTGRDTIKLRTAHC